MSKPLPKRFEIYVEGGLTDTVANLNKARRLKREAESEGWNVKILAIFDTVVGEMGVEYV